ncbi:hypothetical protein QYF36_015708 [Acer negundo]|nr:hypothetical protein QYF36_015708 [Acer negundo]
MLIKHDKADILYSKDLDPWKEVKELLELYGTAIMVLAGLVFRVRHRRSNNQRKIQPLDLADPAKEGRKKQRRRRSCRWHNGGTAESFLLATKSVQSVF